MKLKYITLASFVIFVGTILVLGAWPKNDTSYISNNTEAGAESAVSAVDPVSGVPAAVLTLEEIAKHNTREDCYLIVKGSVYSVAGFIDQHPGGAKKILEMCGKEATAVFTAIHSNFAWNLLKDFYIGKVGESVTASTTTPVSNTTLPTNKKWDDDEYEDEYEKD